jgi:hypothetical protein
MGKTTSKKCGKAKGKLLEALAKCAGVLVGPIIFPFVYQNDAYKKAKAPDSENATPHDSHIDNAINYADNNSYRPYAIGTDGTIRSTLNGTVTGVLNGTVYGNSKDYYANYTGSALEVAKMYLEQGEYGMAVGLYKEAYNSLLEIPENERNALLEQVKSGNVIVTQRLAALVKSEEDELIFNEARAGMVL